MTTTIVFISLISLAMPLLFGWIKKINGKGVVPAAMLAHLLAMTDVALCSYIHPILGVGMMFYVAKFSTLGLISGVASIFMGFIIANL